ncbi:MAG: hypothetical protein JEZ06_21165 [Anaerolineaceae bacterium]|nr:hypothetical protein [Anaerolineaceae bacterium]
MLEQSNTPGWATYLRVSGEDKQSPERSFSMQRQNIQEQLLSSSEVSFSREYTDLLSGTHANNKCFLMPKQASFLTWGFIGQIVLAETRWKGCRQPLH